MTAHGRTAIPSRTEGPGRSSHEVAEGAPVIAMAGAEAVVGGRVIWRGVDVRVGQGEFVAVLGPNGVGKSTLLKVVLGLLAPSAGQVDVFDDRPGRHNDRIGYLPQRRTFDPSMRIRGADVVRLGLDGDRWGVPLPRCLSRTRRADQERLAETIELVGATSYANRPIGQCSGGEQQRLLIAQALVRRPDLLLLDEPLDSLDLTNQAAISLLVQGVCRSLGVAVVMVAHDVNPILAHLDQVIYLDPGGAVTGRPSEVITSETLTMLYGTPVDVLRDRRGNLVVVGQPDTHSHHHLGP